MSNSNVSQGCPECDSTVVKFEKCDQCESKFCSRHCIPRHKLINVMWERNINNNEKHIYLIAHTIISQACIGLMCCKKRKENAKQ